MGKANASRAASAREAFARDVSGHELVIRRDDGLYRHLRFARPDSSINWVEVVTWPWGLYVGGDRDGFAFSRAEDMFQFFRPSAGWNMGDINPSYWAQKVISGLEGTRVYSRDVAERRLWQAVREACEGNKGDAKGLAKDVRREFLDPCYEPIESEWGFNERLRDYTYTRQSPKPLFPEDGEISFADLVGGDFSDWSYHFLWQLHAIVRVISEYDRVKMSKTNNENGA